MNLDSRILITGADGMVGSALLKRMKADGYINTVAPSRREAELRSHSEVNSLFRFHHPEYVFMLAAKVGGIEANRKDRLMFMHDNLSIQANMFSACHEFGVKKALFMGSSCIYPRDCPQPIREEYLLSGPLEKTNEGYALAKIVGLKTAEYMFQEKGMLTVCPMPCNIYGPGDSFDLDKCHVLSALVKRFCDAVAKGDKEITLWGTGKARREFIHVDDVVAAILLIMEQIDHPYPVNVGTGQDWTIKDLAIHIAHEAGFSGEIKWDSTKPDGTPRKLLDISTLDSFRFRPQVHLSEGIPQMVKLYRDTL